VFNIEEFDIKLNTNVIGRNFIYVEEIDSTNNFLMGTKEELPSGTVVLAEHQSDGKGRRNKEWKSDKNRNLTFSILLLPHKNMPEVNLINLSSSLAIAQTLENLYQFDVELKWPNDVLINKKKIAGVLIETVSRSDKIEKIIIGMGINVNQPVFAGKFDLKPTSIRIETKREVSREKLLSEILNQFENNLITLEKSSTKILNAWRLRCKMIGEKVKIIQDKKTKFGIFDDIDHNGFLILKTREGYEKIHYGDISLR